MSLIIRKTVPYESGGRRYQGHLLYQEGVKPDRGLFMAPNFLGVSPAAFRQAERQVNARTAVFLFDPFGVDRPVSNAEEAMKMLGIVRADPLALRRLLTTAVECFQREGSALAIAADRYAAFGFCFGGGCVIEMARSGLPMKAAISFHGTLQTQHPAAAGSIRCPVLVLNGAEDPLVPPAILSAFEQEMTAAGADWTVVNFSQTYHSFTDEGANRPGHNVYSARASRRAFAAMADLLDEVMP